MNNFISASSFVPVLEVIRDSLDDAKAIEVSFIHLDEDASLCDYVVIATGSSDRHISHIVDQVRDGIKNKLDGAIARIAGEGSSAWQIIDAGDVIVHVFSAEARQYYDIERMLLAHVTPSNTHPLEVVTGM